LLAGDFVGALSPAAAAQFVVRCDMKLQSVLLGRSNPDQALRLAAGIPRKHAPDGQRLGGRYCQGCGAFPQMYQTW